jgi:hypothetical protein
MELLQDIGNDDGSRSNEDNCGSGPQEELIYAPDLPGGGKNSVTGGGLSAKEIEDL